MKSIVNSFYYLYNKIMKITMSTSYGFCLGVKNAINIVSNVVNTYQNTKIYLLGKLVHNDFVNAELEKKGVTILSDSSSLEEKISKIDEGVVVFSAHGHDEKLDKIVKDKNLTLIDTTCPRVQANFNSIKKALKNGFKIVYIGIKNHPETIASMSIDKDIIFIDFKNPSYEALKNVDKVSIHNQTTLIQSELIPIYDEIKKLVDMVEIVNDICYATSKRQEALNEISDEDFILIIGDKISSNSTRLYEICQKKYPGKPSFMVNSLQEVINLNLSQYKKGFITAGASTPEGVINPIVNYLKNL